ncbi:hypothetical protein GQ55_7G323000 [Panicum hallii var. hallii]|nr:hypothetical protein GQ55_7G323000 [Panicum hallii var. hallii]
MRKLVIQEIALACREQGCFQVVNHGIRKSVMKGALEAASEFFKLSKEHKEKFVSADVQQPIRYDMSSRDGISTARSLLKHYANPLEDWVQFWPINPPTYRKKMGDYAVEIKGVSMQLMEAIFEGLGDKVGLAFHSDYGFITILLQSSAGFEVMHHEDDTWIAVPAIPGALHVHIGDNLEVLSNGQLKSLVHRTILNPDEPRISIASIHGLSMDEKVHCAKELVDEEHPEMYKESSFQESLDLLPSNMNNYKRFVESLKIDRDE